MSITLDGTSGITTPTYGGATTAEYSVPVTGFKNRIINGGMNVFQRQGAVNTSIAITGSFVYQTIDRWAMAMAATVAGSTSAINTTMPTGFTNAFRIGRTASSTSTGQIYVQQVIESANATDLQGQSITVSFWAKAGANFSPISSNITVLVNTGTGGDSTSTVTNFGSWTGNAVPLASAQAITTTWARYSLTCTIGSTVTNVGLQFNYVPTGTAGADDNLYITGVQLEKGSTATSFDYRPYGTELALCQRYYRKSEVDALYGEGTIYGYNSAANPIGMVLMLPVTMRTAPTVTQNGTWSATNTSTTLGIGGAEPTAVFFYISPTATGACQLRGNNSGYITYSAEL